MRSWGAVCLAVLVFSAASAALARDAAYKTCKKLVLIDGGYVCRHDAVKDDAKKAAPLQSVNETVSGAHSFKGVFYENDFHYLDDPELIQHDHRDWHSRFTDQWKDIKVGRSLVLDLGGEFRTRFQSDNGGALNRPDGFDNDFFLTRLRTYANLKIGDHIRLFGEFIDARAHGVDTPGQAPVAEAKADIRNAFIELHAPLSDGEIYVRGGRQELSFGAQRFISPLDWANSRRTFEGARIGYRSKRLEVSAWRAKPQLSNGIFDTSISSDVVFSGAYVTFHDVANATLDAYVFNFDDDEDLGGNANIWMIGGRGKGAVSSFLWEVEAALQTGNQQDATSGQELDFESHMITAGVGWDTSKALPIIQNIWFYYDLAQGDDDPNDGEVETFNQLFPLAHAYFGHIDFIGRRNVEAISMRLALKPHDRVSMSVGGHRFWRAKTGDGLYNAGGVLIRPSMSDESVIGSEVDVDVSISLTQRATFSAGYAKFFGGAFLDATSSTGFRGDPEFVYTQIQFRF